MMGVRKYLAEEAIDAALGRLGPALLVLHPDAEPHRMGLKEAEHAILGLLEDETLTVEQVLSRAPAEQAAVKRLIYGLLITRCIDLSGQTRRPVGVGAVPERD